MSKKKVKKNVIYACQECGTSYPKWVGMCEECGSWNKITEESADNFAALADSDARVYDLGCIDESLEPVRTTSGIVEFDIAIGGGLVAGSVILLSGEPGIGKSTLLLHLSSSVEQRGFNCIYVSGEESASQIKMRANRLGINNRNIKVMITTDLSCIVKIMESIEPPALMIVDSIQTLQSPHIPSAPGTVSQVRSCSLELINMAKKHQIVLIIVGHVTKDGQVAGPKMLEHMVDTVLYFEGEGTKQYRIVRAIKNRFGPTNEIGVFEMTEIGLAEVSNPSKLFMSQHSERVTGSCIFAAIEGSRSIMAEVQSLAVSSFLATPRRSAVGWDSNRLAMLIAILTTRLGLKLLDKEVYLNVVGGLKVSEPAADLAVAVSLMSACHHIPIGLKTVCFGEIGLLGEIRQVTQVAMRIAEIKKLGFTKVVMPQYSHVKSDGLEIIEGNDIKQLFELLKSGRFT